jgi:dihydrofolate synthase/folylpolyglutamate synthase
MTYSEAIQYLYELRWFGTKLGLTHTLKLAALAGNPHERLQFIHVAGTNGKGSVCAMLESIYRSTGLRVGLFTSPHLVSFGERIQVNRRLISQEDVVRLVRRLQSLLKQLPDDDHPTFFEVITVMALIYFAEQECNLVVWETGMGGRLDATNIVMPLASVITNIHLDHEKWLGQTIEAIAAEKAGIIKPRVPVFSAAAEPDAVRVISETARRQSAPLTLVSPGDHTALPLDKLDLPLAGLHQKANAALALAVVRGLASVLPVSDEHICAGLQRVSWPGRFQKVRTADGRIFVLDGAHNVAGAQALAEALDQSFKEARITLILGILGDKNWAGMCHVLAPLASRVLVVPVKSERTASASDLAAECNRANAAAEVVACDSLDQALALSQNDKQVVIAGSLYLVGEALTVLGLGTTGAVDERGLNEWGDAPVRSISSVRSSLAR